ncbi:MAG: hypothetical protein HDR02_14310, partial [Lachnospiraceae bacterium]|nr:hypothetical protein [Lachnospiraceae bacterium]
ELKTREYMLFIYPAKVPSSVLAEIGYGIALSKQMVIFAQKKSDLPYVLSRIDNAVPSVRIYEYATFDDIIRIVDSNDTAFFD